MTRYPTAGKGAKWTVKELEAITQEWVGDTLSDGGGLVGEVRKAAGDKVKVSFKYGLKLDGKKVWHYCGIFPNVSLAEIRSIRDEAQKTKKTGADPRAKKITDRIETRQEQEKILADAAAKAAANLTVSDMIDAWLTQGVKRANDNKGIIQPFNKYIQPAIGHTQVSRLTDQDLIKIYKAIIEDGKNTTAFELSKDVHQMISWAEIRQPWRSLLIEGNPAALIEIDKLLPKDFTKVRDRCLSIEEIKKLKAVFEDTEKNYAQAEKGKKYSIERALKKEVQIAMWLCLSTLARIGELLMTEWAHVDFEKRTWLIPKENTKKNGKKDSRTDHIVYLSDFALGQFKKLQALTGGGKWAFPARYNDEHVCVKSASKQIGDRQVTFKARTKKLQARVENNSLVLGEQEWTPHDLRRTGATLMQGILGEDKGLLITDLCLHHKVVSGSARHYMFNGYDEAKKDAWQLLGNRLEAILSSENVVSIGSAKAA